MDSRNSRRLVSATSSGAAKSLRSKPSLQNLEEEKVSTRAFLPEIQPVKGSRSNSKLGGDGQRSGHQRGASATPRSGMTPRSLKAFELGDQ